MADQHEGLLQHLVDVHRLQKRFRRPREAQKLIYQAIDAVDLVADQIREGFTEVRVLISLREQLRESLDRDERIFDLVRHARRERPETGQAIAPANL